MIAAYRGKTTKSCTRTRALLLGGALLLVAALPLPAANITVPLLELYTWGHETGSGWGFETAGAMEIRLDGGYKFGATLLFGFAASPSASLPQPLETAGAAGTSLAFRAASVTLRELFGLPLDLTYFIGEGDTFASGDLFPEYFGTVPLASTYTDFLHLPTAAHTYEGIYTPTGTGLHLDFAPKKDRWLLSLYLYQDSLIDLDADPGTLDPGFVSLDVRSALNLETVKLEGFLGATIPEPGADFGSYRAGFLFFAGAKRVQFVAQMGVPSWTPGIDTFTFDLFYMLLEQRVRLKVLSVVQTVLWRPAYYQHAATGERAVDINLDVQVGTAEALFSGGLEGNLVYQTDPPLADEVVAKLSPYVRLSTSGVVVETRFSTRVWPFDWADMFQLFFAVKAEF